MKKASSRTALAGSSCLSNEYAGRKKTKSPSKDDGPFEGLGIFSSPSSARRSGKGRQEAGRMRRRFRLRPWRAGGRHDDRRSPCGRRPCRSPGSGRCWRSSRRCRCRPRRDLQVVKRSLKAQKRSIFMRARGMRFVATVAATTLKPRIASSSPTLTGESPESGR